MDPGIPQEHQSFDCCAGKLVEALIKAQEKFSPLQRNAVNPYFNSKYATLEACIEATHAALAANGLVVIQYMMGDDLCTRLQHVSGQYIEGRRPLHAVKQDPQGIGSAMTYARRYDYCAIVGLAPEDDLDGNEHTAPPASKSAPAPASRETAEKMKATIHVVSGGPAKKRDGTPIKSAKGYPLFEIMDSDGTRWTTWRKEVYEAAGKAKESEGGMLSVEYTENKFGKTIEGLL